MPVQAETVTEPAHEGQTVDMQILSTTDLHTNLVNYDYYQDKPSQTVGLSKTAVLIKKARETNPNTVLVDRGDTIQGIPFGTYKALIDPVAQGETHHDETEAGRLGLASSNLHQGFTLSGQTQDTDVTPFDPGAFASRQSYVAAPALRSAALLLKEKIIAHLIILNLVKIYPCMKL